MNKFKLIAVGSAVVITVGGIFMLSRSPKEEVREDGNRDYVLLEESKKPSATTMPTGTILPQETITPPPRDNYDGMTENGNEITEGFRWSEIPKVIGTTKAPDGRTLNIYENGRTYYQLHDLDDKQHITVGGDYAIYEADISDMKFVTYKTTNQKFDYSLKVPKGFDVIELEDQLILRNGWEQYSLYFYEGRINAIYQMKASDTYAEYIEYDTGECLYEGSTKDMSIEFDDYYDGKRVLSIAYRTGANEIYCDSFMYLTRRMNMPGGYGYGHPLNLKKDAVNFASSSIYSPKNNTTTAFICFSKKYTQEQLLYMTKVISDSMTVDKDEFKTYDFLASLGRYTYGNKIICVPKHWRITSTNKYFCAEPISEGKKYMVCLFKESEAPTNQEEHDKYIIDTFILGESNAKQATYELGRLQVEETSSYGKVWCSSISIKPKDMKTKDMFQGDIDKMLIDKHYIKDGYICAFIYYGTQERSEDFRSAVLCQWR